MNIRQQQFPKRHFSLNEIEPSQLETCSIDELISIANQVDCSGHSTCDFHKKYFSWAKHNDLHLKLGVITTPSYIAEYMVSETIRATKKTASELSWYDPCCGSGIFIEAILCKCLNDAENPSETSLPNITAAEVSPIGILYTALVIKCILTRYKLDFYDCMSSRKFNLILGDSLSLFEEENSLFGDANTKFDITIGNPPYVRSTRLSAPQKQRLKQQFPFTYSGNADLYFYFISSAISSLKDDGIMSFISPANFFRSRSAIQLRGSLEKRSKLVKLIDLDELPVFENADIHTTIYWLQKSVIGEQDTHFSYCHLTARNDLNKIKDDSLSFENMLISGIESKGWRFIAKNSDDDLTSYKDVISIKNSGLKIYSGIRPSIKKAFIYSNDAVSSLNPDVREKWFRPCLEAKHISKWSAETSGYFILLIPNEINSIPPDLQNIIYPFKEALLKSHDSRKGSKWFSLRPCSYYSIFEKPRIVFPDISSRAKFSLDKTKSIGLDGSFSIDSDNKALLGVLNSKRAWGYLINNCSSIGNAKNKGRLRLKKSHVENLPVPKAIFSNSCTTKELSLIVESIIEKGETDLLIEKMNYLVDSLYLENK